MSASSDIQIPSDLNLADYFLFDRLREGKGDNVAIRFGDRTYTYADVADRARRFAAYLRSRGIEHEQRIYIVIPDSPAFVWTLFGTLANGSVVAMGNPEAPPDDLLYVLDYIRASVLVTTPAVADALGAKLETVASLRLLLLVPDVPTGGDVEGDVARPSTPPRGLPVRPLARVIAEANTDEPLPRVQRDDMAIWLFTSGSTGHPKAAMHTHGDFAYSTEAYAKRTIGYRESDCTVSVPRLFFGYATGTNLFFPFSVGASVGLYSERPTPESLGRAIERYRATIVTNVPTMLSKLVEYDEAREREGTGRFDLSSVRFHLSAGEALCPHLLERFRQRFGTEVYDGIGSAEMFHIYVSNRPGDVKPGSLGKIVTGYSVKILPPEAEGPGMAELPRGETGVLWVRGNSVALGYYQDREKSWEVFHGAWCRTGDLFRMDEEGYLWFCGRADDLLKVNGQWVAPLEVEQCLMAHPDVALAAVVGVEEHGLVKPRAFVVVQPSARSRISSAANRVRFRLELQAHVRQRLSKHKYPRSIVFIDDLPKNDRGKVDRRALRVVRDPEEDNLS